MAATPHPSGSPRLKLCWGPGNCSFVGHFARVDLEPCDANGAFAAGAPTDEVIATSLRNEGSGILPGEVEAAC